MTAVPRLLSPRARENRLKVLRELWEHYGLQTGGLGYINAEGRFLSERRPNQSVGAPLLTLFREVAGCPILFAHFAKRAGEGIVGLSIFLGDAAVTEKSH